MMKSLVAVAVAAASLAPAAFAAEQMPKGQVAGYLSQSGFDTGPVDDDGLGLGVRGWGSLNGPWFVHGEFQKVKTDDFDVSLQQFRVGGGLVGPINPQVMWLAKAEYIDLGNDLDESGLGIHGGLFFAATPQVELFGTLGYLTTDHTDGLELDLGAQFALTHELSLVADYRTYMGSVDGGGDLDLDDLRIGLGFTFY